jgi:hypothetical protein
MLDAITEKIKSAIGVSTYPLVDVKSSVDNQIYKVRALPDRQQAADLIARIRLRLARFSEYLETTYPDKPQVKRLVANFRADPKHFLEATPDAAHTSYSINKGEEVHLCLRQRQPGNESLVGEEVMMFVALHELAHSITQTIGHGPDFWNNFGWILREAEHKGFYTHQNFAAQPVTYCGVSITDQPKYDPDKDDGFIDFGSRI